MPEPVGQNRLDSPPPAPPGMVRRVPDTPAPAGPMMGGDISQNTLPQAVIERAMMAERALKSMSEVAPSLTPLVAGLVDQLHAGVAGMLQGGGTAPQPPTAPSGMAGIMSMGAPPAAGAA